MSSPVFATLDRMPAVDPIEGLGTQHFIEFRGADGFLIERIHGTHEACVTEAVRRNFLPGSIRIPRREKI